jgi:hypothetical protein
MPDEPLGLDVTARVRVRKYRAGERPETHEPFEVVEGVIEGQGHPTEDRAPGEESS